MVDAYEKMNAPRTEEELHLGKSAPVRMEISPIDGMPSPIVPMNLDTSPVLSPETFVCMADQSSYVVRSWEDGEVNEIFEPSDVRQQADGSYVVEKSVKTFLGLGRRLTLVYVEPVRPACEHYLMAMTDIAADRDRRYIERSCMKKRTESGEYYSLRDGAVFACTLREPRDIRSEKLLENFDAGKMAEAVKLKEEGEFDIDAELKAEQGKLGVLG